MNTREGPVERPRFIEDSCTYVNPEHLPDGCKATMEEHDFPKGASFKGVLSRDYTHHAWCAKPFDWAELDGEEGATG